MTLVWGFGSGECDQLGIGDEYREVKTPKRIYIVPSSISVAKIVCGGMHTLLLTTEGFVYSWGIGDDGALGRSGTEAVPQLIVRGIKCRISDISAGDGHSVAYNSEIGAIYVWGRYRNLQRGDVMSPIRYPQQVGKFEFKRMQIQKVVCGAQHTLYLVSGRVYASGDSDNFNVGPLVSSEDKLSGLEITLVDKGWDKTDDIFAGSYHSFAVKRYGGLFAWGHNESGQLGTGDFESSRNLKKVLNLDATRIKSIVGGESHTVALMDNGDLYSWGNNDSYKLGLQSQVMEGLTNRCLPIPRKIEGIGGIAKISAGSHYTYALDGLWQLYSWGMGENYVLGTRNDDDVEQPTQTLGKFTEENRIVDISAGAQHAIIITGTPQLFNPDVNNPEFLTLKERRRSKVMMRYTMN